LGSTWNDVGLPLTAADIFDIGVLNQVSFLLHVVVIVLVVFIGRIAQVIEARILVPDKVIKLIVN
jgi:hypothetical protein